MKIIADLGKLNNGNNVLVLEKGKRIEFALASGYNPEAPEGSQWDHGTYLYSLESLARAILYCEKPIGYDRMSEIASKAIDGLREDDEETAREYLMEEVELDEAELEYFGLEEWKEED